MRSPRRTRSTPPLPASSRNPPLSPWPGRRINSKKRRRNSAESRWRASRSSMDVQSNTAHAGDKAMRVRQMFAEIAPRYDLLNHLLSLNIDRRWRRFAVRQLHDRLSLPGARVLDLCCGTADLSIELATQ